MSSTSSKSKTTAVETCPECESTLGDALEGQPHRRPASLHNRERYEVCSVCGTRLP